MLASSIMMGQFTVTSVSPELCVGDTIRIGCNWNGGPVQETFTLNIVGDTVTKYYSITEADIKNNIIKLKSPLYWRNGVSVLYTGKEWPIFFNCLVFETGINEYQNNGSRPEYFDLYGVPCQYQEGVILIEKNGNKFRKVFKMTQQ